MKALSHMQRERWWPWKREPSEKKKKARIYPPSVMYDLEYGATLTRDSLKSLIMNGFPREFFYLATKSLADNPHTQLNFLSFTLPILLDYFHNQLSSQKQLLASWDLLSPDTTVQGAKLAQFNRRGSEEWHTDFQKLIAESIKKHPEFLPILILHTPLSALPDFINLYQENNSPDVYLFNFDWIKQAQKYTGYRVEILQPEPKISLLTADQFGELKDRPIYLFDDTVRDDQEIDAIISFFEQQIQVARWEVRAITNFREDLRED